MSEAKIFDEPESSSDEEDPIVDEDTCGVSEIESAFPVKYNIVDESAVSLKKVYVLCLCADKNFGKIAAGLSKNSVQIFDINSRGLSHPSVDTLTLDNFSAVCGLRYIDEVANSLLVGSMDGDVSLYDLRTGIKEHSFANIIDGSKMTIDCFDINANGRVICSGTDKQKGSVYLQFFDVRKKTLMGGYCDSHQDDMTAIEFHPTNPDLLCTGSTDGLINLFDISASTEDDALTMTFNTESSVQKLNWHKNVYEKDLISCITHTNDLKMYECEEGDVIAECNRSQVTEAIKRKAVEECNLVSCHNLADDGGMFLLATSNFNKGEVVRSVQLQGKKLLPHGNFNGNKQIIRESVHDPKTNFLVTGGESGIVTLWSPSAIDQPKSGPNKLKAKSKTEKPHKKGPY